MDEKKVILKEEKAVAKTAKKVLPKAKLSAPVITASKPIVIVSKSAVKKAVKPQAVVKSLVSVSNVITPKELDKRVKSIDVKSKDINKQVLITIKDIKDYKSHVDTIDSLILNALNNKNHSYKIEIACFYE